MVSACKVVNLHMNDKQASDNMYPGYERFIPKLQEEGEIEEESGVLEGGFSMPFTHCSN